MLDLHRPQTPAYQPLRGLKYKKPHIYSIYIINIDAQRKIQKGAHLADVIWPKACYNVSFLWQLRHKVCNLLTLRKIQTPEPIINSRNFRGHLDKTLYRILANHASHTFSRSVICHSSKVVHLIECYVNCKVTRATEFCQSNRQVCLVSLGNGKLVEVNTIRPGS